MTYYVLIGATASTPPSTSTLPAQVSSMPASRVHALHTGSPLTPPLPGTGTPFFVSSVFLVLFFFLLPLRVRSPYDYSTSSRRARAFDASFCPRPPGECAHTSRLRHGQYKTTPSFSSGHHGERLYSPLCCERLYEGVFTGR